MVIIQVMDQVQLISHVTVGLGVVVVLSVLPIVAHHRQEHKHQVHVQHLIYMVKAVNTPVIMVISPVMDQVQLISHVTVGLGVVVVLSVLLIALHHQQEHKQQDHVLHLHM
ncbi:uncharacterized protein LOC144436069 [Glandiceps talaboti]